MTEEKNYNLERGKENLHEQKVDKHESGQAQEQLHTHEQVSEFAETIEAGVETPHEQLAEKKETEKSTAGQQAAGTIQHFTAEEKARQKLIEIRQPRKRLEKDLKTFYQKEIKKQKKQAHKYKNNPETAYLYSECWTKIRKFYQALSDLAFMTYEALKKLWLKLLHGISV